MMILNVCPANIEVDMMIIAPVLFNTCKHRALRQMSSAS